MSRMVHLVHDEVSVVIDVSGGAPALIHWGARLEAPDAQRMASMTRRPTTHGSLDVVPALQIVPQHSLGSQARPGLQGHRPGGRDWAPRFSTCDVQTTERSVTTSSRDAIAKLRLDTRIELDASGALCVSATVINEGDSRFLLDALTISLPVPSSARDLTTYSGRWSRESATHRQTIDHGAWTTENRTGRTSHEYPPTVWWSTTDAREWTGEVWGVHLAYSGNHAVLAEVLPDGRRYTQLGELLMPGEVCLDLGGSYTTPKVVGAYGANGFTSASWVLHRHVRSVTPTVPVRKVLLNTWEATYFNHDTAALSALADAAADIGIERFVLDDGWFGARRNDRAGLGDWVVSREVYPQGLAPLIAHVKSRGMDFGIWIEPEMVNRDSDLVRVHPDWVLHAVDYVPVMARHQLLLDLTNEQAFAHVFAQLDALLRDHDIAFVKWDMNRPLIHASAADGAAGAHRQTLAFYRLLDALRTSHPQVEFESCASGGGRIDHAVLSRAVRVWTSDCNDPLERQHIQRGTGMWVPNEVLGMHVGAKQSHTTGRSHSIELRALTALFGWMGVECDPQKLNDHDRSVLREAIALHKQHRALLHSGDAVRFDLDDNSALAHGVFAADRRTALLAYVQLQTSPWLVVPRWRISGLDPERTYTVTHLPLGRTGGIGHTQPEWMTTPLTCTGRELAVVGLQPPSLWPESGMLVHVTS
ncbi:MAG: alpha-galactosidase [Actinobacteria bacterium]|nr:alpha-galactosidase [Actinomycetota bacterium]